MGSRPIQASQGWPTVQHGTGTRTRSDVDAIPICGSGSGNHNLRDRVWVARIVAGTGHGLSEIKRQRTSDRADEAAAVRRRNQVLSTHKRVSPWSTVQQTSPPLPLRRDSAIDRRQTLTTPDGMEAPFGESPHVFCAPPAGQQLIFPASKSDAQ